MNFGRVLTAMVTPFDHQGEVDYPATKNLIDHLIANGTDALVVAGTTGESPTLTNEEKVALFSFAVKEVNGRIPVIAGTGSNNTRESIALTAEAESTGVDGVMLVVPYYNKPNQEGMYQHFKTIAESTSLPVMMYNVPGRTASVLEPDTVVRLASDVDNIVSVKEASGNLDAIADIIERTDEDFTLYSGDDGLTLPILAIGGTGIVSVSSHVLGQEMQQMVQAHFAGRPSEAAAIHREILPKCQALFSAPSPTPVKAVLNMAGVPVGDVRLPLVPLSDEEHRELMRKMQLQITRVS
ncbi:MAG TPA: 4-hydroxy-tetrahydrodipicolinate synthase [Pseudogracilibacillus sp.]|nr:4-hydroxy-tetrahydrodipicolinate synthase [Pseudogracilibacillus sp.]